MEEYFWEIAAKTGQEKENGWLPLPVHLLDTAGVAEYLLSDWLPDGFWRSFGLSREELENLTVLAALLHDIGKATPCFAQRITEQARDLRERMTGAGLEIPASYEKEQQIGHPQAGAMILRQAGFDKSFAAIVGAHHGKPEERDEKEITYPKSLGWASNGGRNTSWGKAQDETIRWALDQVGMEGPKEVPVSSMTAQMQIAALVIMADWIASNTAYFPLLGREERPKTYDFERVDRALARLSLPKPWQVSADWNRPDYFEERFGFPANGVQQAVMQAAREMKKPEVMILEAPMGQGKTEAALAAAEVLMNRFSLGGAAFFLPSQATSNAMFTRMHRWADSQPDAEGIAAALVHGQSEFNEEFSSLERGTVQIEQGEEQIKERAEKQEKDQEKLTVHSFFRGRKTRLLANLVVGTIDQLLMAALQQKHVMLRQLGLVGKVVIIDECHAYDAYMSVYLDRILDWLGAYGVPVILLSATLPGERRRALAQAYLGRPRAAAREIQECRDYPLLTWTQAGKIHSTAIPPEGRSRKVEIQKMSEEAAWKALGKVLEGGCAGVIVNTVSRAQALRDRLEQEYPQAVIWMDHSRFLTPDRLAHEEEILKRVGKKSSEETRKGVLVIGTQVLEQSLDLDFDLLITDLCPMDLLLQRIGRLHRHERPRPPYAEEARCIVLGAEGEPEAGTKAVYDEYLLLRTRDLLPEVIRLPEDISPLVQETYGETQKEMEQGGTLETAEKIYKEKRKEEASKARAYCLAPPSRDGFFDNLKGLLDRAPGTSEAKAQAAVRDGTAPLEVLVVQRTENGTMRLLSGPQTGEEFRSDTQPSGPEAKSIAAQRLRLPGHFGQSWCVDQVIDALETQTNTYLSEWRKAPMLEGELFLILDRKGQAELEGKTLYYDSRRGLREKEESHGGNCV